MSEADPNERTVTARRWPGALLSLLVPGFGLLRVGRPLRALAWFIGLQLFAVAVALLAIARPVPWWAAAVAIVASWVAVVFMLMDSFRPGRMTWRLWIAFVAAFAALLALPTPPFLIARAFRVPTGAMEPTLIGATHGTPDHVIVDRIAYLFSPPKRGDLVVFRTAGISRVPQDAYFIKRLVGLPGERIEIRAGRLFLNDRQLDERDGIPPFEYVNASRSSTFPPVDSYFVREDEFFFLGDNSKNSYDSRYWGSVPRENIYGRVARIYYPLARSGVPR